MSPYVIVACCLLTAVTSSRLLLVPFDHKGNLNFLLVLGQELHERGHDVDVLVPKHSEALVTSYGLHPLVAPYTVDTDNVLGEGVFKAGGGGLESVLTAQNIQPRVQVSPRSIIVPVPPLQHSPIFGH